ncbi:MAG: type I methionyl aminopeptidase [Planctomycetes bacterium]|nr:type I methionyl aminopeptidase [Planctomycetota bacterium]
MAVPKRRGEIKRMRAAGRIVAEVLDRMGGEAQVGVTTGRLDKIVEELIRTRGGVPVFKGYSPSPAHGPYPCSICTSVNEEVVHGIPGPRKLEEGDLLSIDVGVSLNGYCADAAITLGVGDVSDDAARLSRVCRESLDLAIDAARAGARVSDVSRVVQTYVEGEGYSVVREYTGHGIGRELHENPRVPNYVSVIGAGRDTVLRPGITLAIEPMVNQGTYATEVLANRWTVVTADRKLSAHWEHTVAVTKGRADILTV